MIKLFQFFVQVSIDESHPFIMVSASFIAVGLLVVSCRILSSRSLFTFDIVMFLISSKIVSSAFPTGDLDKVSATTIIFQVCR